MKKILLAFLAAFLIASPVNAHKSKLFDSVRALGWTSEYATINMETGDIVPVKVFGNHCTITSINEKKHLWLTAAHCVANEDMTAVEEDHDYQIGNDEAGYAPAVLVKVDLEDDLAILAAPSMKVKALKVASDMADFGDKIQIVGHPFGWPEAVLFVGTVAHPEIQFDLRDKSYMVYQAAGAPGNSGSAVVNSHDEIISVLQISWDRTFSPVLGGSPQRVLQAFVNGYMN